MGPRMDLQILATFDARRADAPLRLALNTEEIEANIGFTSRQQIKEYMLTPSAETEHIAGTIVLVRVEDWLRDHCSSDGHPGDAWAREELKSRVREFASEISILAYRGKPVWFMACPSVGWIAERYKMTSLCRTYTNLLSARVGNVAEITSLNWPAGCTGNDIAADESGNAPFTQECFDRIAEVLATDLGRARAGKTSGQATPEKSPELAAYLAGLLVRVELAIVDISQQHYIDKIMRTAASFSLTGEQPHISENEVNAAIASEKCAVVSVSDRVAEHGISGVLAYHEVPDALVIDWMSLSCTVLGKQVEYALLSALAQMATERGLSNIVFEYRPSARNQPIQAFLEAVADRESETRFSLAANDAEARINAKTVNPGAWTIEVKGLGKPAGTGR
jgi:hypothetical protein